MNDFQERKVWQTSLYQKAILLSPLPPPVKKKIIGKIGNFRRWQTKKFSHETTKYSLTAYLDWHQHSMF
jgi:hypothetical protein